MPSSCIRLLEATQNFWPQRFCISATGKKPMKLHLQRGREKRRQQAGAGRGCSVRSGVLTGRQTNGSLQEGRESTARLAGGGGGGTPIRREKDKYRGLAQRACLRVCLVQGVLNNGQELSKAGADRDGVKEGVTQAKEGRSQKSDFHSGHCRN